MCTCGCEDKALKDFTPGKPSTLRIPKLLLKISKLEQEVKRLDQEVEYLKSRLYLKPPFDNALLQFMNDIEDQ